MEFIFENRFLSKAARTNNRNLRNLRERVKLNTCSSRMEIWKYENVLKLQCTIMTSLRKTFDLKKLPYAYTYTSPKMFIHETSSHGDINLIRMMK